MLRYDLVNQRLINIKINKKISVGKIYKAIERYIDGTVVAFTTILGQRL